MLGCGSTKTNQSSAKTDSVIVAEQGDLNQRDSVIGPNETNLYKKQDRFF